MGGHLARAFVREGYRVRCALRAFSDPRPLSGLPGELVRADFDRTSDLSAASKGVDVVVHAAGITRARHPGDYHRVNAGITRRLAAAALREGVGRFVLVSSLAARGPDARSAGGDRPASPYGVSKLEAERCLRSLGGGMETVVLRPAAVYGPRDRDFLPLFRMARRGLLVLPSGRGSLQPVYAPDVARAALAAARGGAGFGPFPLAERRRYTWKEVAAALEQALGRRVRVLRVPAVASVAAGRAAEGAARLLGSEPLFDERRARDLAVHAWTCDTTATERALGWRAGVPLPEGLKRTLRWYRREGWL
ncbi:Nucleoside-diphosphate-sugar epimerase (plasmid) [Rubrobacter radiotolerans]|uniref:Nucleoside-diphosphate-sugar epimerase n=1 Tax=Rubrobacter radiotolerans TaxID=42256 RepID=A0A023X6M0_RUBRA|nr:Nucleoside-diphosphate-sugar epimerase [Rubrobacter radiotolerans]